MTEQTLRIGGGVVFWSVGQWTDLFRLTEHMSDAGFGDLIPEKRPYTQALKDALEETVGGPKILIRALKKRMGFTVVEETQGEDRNDYAQLMYARLEPVDGGEPRLEFSHRYDGRADKVTAAYEKHMGLLGAGQTGGCMVRIVERLGGTRLRPGGGVYWLPTEQLDLWDRAAKALEASAAEGARHTAYILRHQMDSDAIKAVRDAITSEILDAANKLGEEIGSGELKARALDARAGQAQDLIEKVAHYEELLGLGLEQLREAATAAKRAAAAATLMAAASGEAVGV